MHSIACLWKSEDSFVESVLPVGSVKLGLSGLRGKCLYLPSRLTGSVIGF